MEEMIAKTNGNFDKLVEEMAAKVMEVGFRSLYDKAKYYDSSWSDTLNYNHKEMKATIKKELRRNWKPQGW